MTSEEPPKVSLKYTGQEVVIESENDVHIAPEGRRMKWLKTFFLYAPFMGLGIASALVPSTILDLRDQLRVDTYTMSFAYTTQYAGTFIGGIVAGFLSRPRCFPAVNVFCASLVAFAAVVIYVPWIYDVIICMASLGIWGVINGFADTVNNFLLIRVWTSEVGPYLQGLHLVHAIGSFLTPVIAAPFLSKRHASTAFNSTTDTFTNETITRDNKTHMGKNDVVEESELLQMTESRIRYAYMIVGVYIGIMGLSVCFCSVAKFWQPRKDVDKETDADKVTGTEKDVTKENKNSKIPESLARLQTIKFLILLFLILFLYGSLQSSNGGFLLVFVADGLNWSKTQGTYLVSGFWIAYSVSRVTGIIIFATKVISVGKLLALNVLLITTSNIILVIFAQNHFIVPWITTLASAMGQGTLLIAILVWYQENIMEIDGVIPSIVTAAMSVGSITVPLLTGYLIDKVHFMCYAYVLLALSVLITAFASIIYGSLKMYRSKSFQVN